MRYKKNIGWMILAGIVFAFLYVFVAMTLWNWLIPELFEGPQLTFLQAAGLLFLAKIIVGFGGGKGGWKKNRHKRKQDMSSMEKEALKRRFMERCGWEKEKEDETKSEE